jgi:hypothetical protein
LNEGVSVTLAWHPASCPFLMCMCTSKRASLQLQKNA